MYCLVRNTYRAESRLCLRCRKVDRLYDGRGRQSRGTEIERCVRFKNRSKFCLDPRVPLRCSKIFTTKTATLSMFVLNVGRKFNKQEIAGKGAGYARFALGKTS